MQRYIVIGLGLATMVIGQSSAMAKVRSKKPPAAFARAGKNVGIVASFNGAPTLDGDGKTFTIVAAMPVLEGDVVSTGETGRVKILLDDDSVITLGPNSKFKVETADLKGDKRQLSLKVLSGKFLAAVSRWFGSDSAVTIATPTAVAGVRGTVLWGDTGRDAICVLYGTIDVTSVSGGDGTKVKLDAGNCATKMAQGKTDPLAPTADQVQTYLGEVKVQ